MPSIRFTLIGMLLLATTHAEIIINTQILNSDQVLQPATLNTNLQQNAIPAASTISSSTGSQVVIMQCGTGQYAEGGASACVNCAAGTASAVQGATSHLVCQACSAGSFASEAASQCTQCNGGTFSPTPLAVSSAACISCPPNTNSAQGAGAVSSCVCNDSFFLPTNQLQPLDPRATIQFGSWDGLAVGTSILDVPHVSCANNNNGRRLFGN